MILAMQRIINGEALITSQDSQSKTSTRITQDGFVGITTRGLFSPTHDASQILLH